jgi:hypothetical protein
MVFRSLDELREGLAEPPMSISPNRPRCVSVHAIEDAERLLAHIIAQHIGISRAACTVKDPSCVVDGCRFFRPKHARELTQTATVRTSDAFVVLHEM